MAAGPTFEPIATTTLSGSASAIAFSSIPSTYTDLRIVFVGKGSGNLTVNFNADYSTNYSYTDLYGNGTSAFSGRSTSASNFDLNARTSALGTTPMFVTMDIFSYRSSVYKTVLNTVSYDLNGSGTTVSEVGLWRNTTALTLVELLGSFSAGTTATLYGIKAA